MNKKGFTLVELLAVIIILSVLALLASTSVTKVVRDSKTDLYNTQIELIRAAAEAWGADNLYKLPDAGTCKYMKLSDLEAYGLINPNVTNPKTGKAFDKNLLIKITGAENRFGLNNITYEVDAENVDGCEIIYPICTLVSGNANEIGSKYQCQVKNNMEEGFENGYFFFVLSHNEDGTTNLIMERNIYYDEINDVGKVATETNKGTVAWISKEDYKDDLNYGEYGNPDKGPITLMNYLYNATKDWDNLQGIDFTYKDYYFNIITRNNVTQIKKLDGTVTASYTNLKARLPKTEEVGAPNLCLSHLYHQNRGGSCPLWLVNYLTSSQYYPSVDGKVEVSGISGYWLIDLSDADSTRLIVFADGEIGDSLLYYSHDGVRPVITVPNIHLSEKSFD